MIYANIILGENVEIDPSSTFNNVRIGSDAKIAKLCSIFGSQCNPVRIGAGSYVGMMSVINGYAAEVTIGERVSIASRVTIMTDSGPNASRLLQVVYPIKKGPVTIGEDCWIGTNTVVGPNVVIGRCVVVGANSFVNSSVESFSVVGGNPSRLIRRFTCEEIRRIEAEAMSQGISLAGGLDLDATSGEDAK